ncbi:MAG: hypothetical protein ACJ79K_18345 [Gemmatimonadaceae bacterium]
MKGRDEVGHFIGPWQLGKWQPVLQEKQTFCGILRQLSQSSTDDDWRINIEPQAAFPAALLFEMASQTSEPQHIACNGHCIHAEFGLEGHFPLDNELFSTRWANLDDSGDANKSVGVFPFHEPVCVYGPLVLDAAPNHGNKPEIHPAEIIWWRTTTAASYYYDGRYWPTVDTHVWLVQDDSQRLTEMSEFSRAAQYGIGIAKTLVALCARAGNPGNCPSNVPRWSKIAGLRPWAMAPRQSELRIPFDVSLAGDSMKNVVIDEIRSRYVVTAADPDVRRDGGPGTELWLKYGQSNAILLRVVELQPDDHVGVQIETRCIDAETGHLVGDIVLRTKYGKHQTDGEGYQSLVIRTSQLPPLHESTDMVDQRAIEARHSLLLVADREVRKPFLPPAARLRRSESSPDVYRVGPVRNVGGRLVADVSVPIGVGVSNQIVPARWVVGDSVMTLWGRTDHWPGRRVKDSRDTLRIHNVPVLQRGVLEFETVDSTKHQLPMQGMALAPSIPEAEPVAPQLAGDAWPAFLTTLGAERASTAVGGDLMRSNDWTVEIQPQYAAIDDDNFESPEDESPVARELNAAINSDSAGPIGRAQATLFGANNPFIIDWTFAATELASGKAIPVHVGTGAMWQGIFIDTGRSGGSKFQALVHFPETGHNVYRVDGMGTLRDIFGLSAQVRFTVWSHFIQAPADSGALQLLAFARVLAGVSSEEFAQALSATSSAVDPTPTVMRDTSAGALQRRVRAEYALVRSHQAVSDGYITQQELIDLVHYVAQIGGKR